MSITIENATNYLASKGVTVTSGEVVNNFDDGVDPAFDFAALENGREVRGLAWIEGGKVYAEWG